MITASKSPLFFLQAGLTKITYFCRFYHHIISNPPYRTFCFIIISNIEQNVYCFLPVLNYLFQESYYSPSEHNFSNLSSSYTSAQISAFTAIFRLGTKPQLSLSSFTSAINLSFLCLFPTSGFNLQLSLSASDFRGFKPKLSLSASDFRLQHPLSQLLSSSLSASASISPVLPVSAVSIRG